MAGEFGTPLERFEKKYIPEPNSGCWLWLAQVSASGYGRFCVSKDGRAYAHHFSYRTFKGPIPKGMVVRHTCDIKTCVNPYHLLLGTEEENYEDARARRRYHLQHDRRRAQGLPLSWKERREIK
jgi:hypothetical protein